MFRVMLRRMSLIIGLCAALVVTGAHARERRISALSAREILDRMAEVYRSCSSYRDSGIVKTVFISGDGSRVVEKPFKTAFVRPDRFRFEYSEKQFDGEEQRYIVWRRGKEVMKWWDLSPGVENSESLSMALAGATGVSSGSAHTIPVLLMPREISGRCLTDLGGEERSADAYLGGKPCYRIHGTYNVSPQIVWIDQETFLVRRIDAKTRFDGFRTESEVTYNPVIDRAMPEKYLEFMPVERVAEIHGPPEPVSPSAPYPQPEFSSGEWVPADSGFDGESGLDGKCSLSDDTDYQDIGFDELDKLDRESAKEETRIIDFTIYSKGFFPKEDEFLKENIRRLTAVPVDGYGKGAVVAVHPPGAYRSPYSFLTTSMPGNLQTQKGVPIAAGFQKPVRQVTVWFHGARVRYELAAYRSDGSLVERMSLEAAPRNFTRMFFVTVRSIRPDIAMITFGHSRALLAIAKIELRR